MSKKNKEMIAELIRRFVRGNAEDWEWDDFESVTQSDPELERIRLAAVDIAIAYPATTKHEWCSNEGTKKLLELADRIV